MTRQMIALFFIALSFIGGCGRSAEALNQNRSSSTEPLISSQASVQSPPVSTSVAQISSSSEPQPHEQDWRLMLVNSDHPIPEDWSVNLAMTHYGYEVDARIVDAVDELISAAANDGVSLIICYGYRTLEQSMELFEKQINKQLALGLSQEQATIEARRWVAPPELASITLGWHSTL